MTTERKHFNVTIDQPGRTSGVTANADSAAPVSHSLVPVSRELDTLRDKLGWLENLNISRQNRKEVQKAIAEGYLQLIEAQKQLLVAKITVGLDAAKKALLLEQLRMSGEIEKEISGLSAEFAQTITDSMLDAALGAGEAEMRNLDKVEAAYHAGRINAARYQEFKELAAEATTVTNNLIKTTASQILQGHNDRIVLCLQHFKERILGS
jgi:hypothetical protein